MIRKVASILGPVTLSHLISERCWYMNKLWPIGLGRYARHALDIMLGETYQQPQKKYNLRLKLQVTSGKLQAPSDTTCGCVDNFNKDLTCRIIPDTV